MRILTLVAVSSSLACLGAPNPAQTPAPDTEHLATDSSNGGPAIVRVLAARPMLQCPMPVVVPDSQATVPMPVSRPRAVPRMPVVKPGCVNPLFRRDSVAR